mmetsp:Transcript_23310/g.39705  ORF Transcript_23310/g.39705 Transcript_23310/m.39705 type:complete len:88 (-) Transcript_23310:115-378(-)
MKARETSFGRSHSNTERRHHLARVGVGTLRRDAWSSSSLSRHLAWLELRWNRLSLLPYLIVTSLLDGARMKFNDTFVQKQNLSLLSM